MAQRGFVEQAALRDQRFLPHVVRITALLERVREMLDELSATIAEPGRILNVPSGAKRSHEQGRIAQQIADAFAGSTRCARLTPHKGRHVTAGIQRVHERSTA
jgi:hypothetical protein